MSINIYLIRLLVSFVFGFSGAIITLLIYFAISGDWYVGEKVWLSVLSHIIVIAIFLGSGYSLWIIR
jgi:hypothetical protein